jgi:riboflavin synthase
VFSGLVECQGMVRSWEARAKGGVELQIESSLIAEDARIGDSICVNGCCLTVVRIEPTSALLFFEAGAETLSKINSEGFAKGAKVNLERSLKLGDRIGGHLVTGHVDGLGIVDRRIDHGDWSDFWFVASKALMRQMAAKGSIAVDGVSLTLVEVAEDRFSVALIPHTLAVTTLGGKKKGDRVNLETDILAKYVERQLTGTHDAPAG